MLRAWLLPRVRLPLVGLFVLVVTLITLAAPHARADALALVASAPTTPPKGSLTFTASGGSGMGYAYAFQTNASGGTIDPATGAYTAGATGNVTDTLKVTDSDMNTATASVMVGAPVTLAPAAPNPAPRASITFVASGGFGAGWIFSFDTNASGGTIDPATGVYTAGPTGSVVDKVRVVDPLGNSATANVTVKAGVSIVPAAPNPAPRASINFTATGGSGAGYSYSYTTNASGGSLIAATGAYTAGSTGSVVDQVTVTDSLGNTATATITVKAGVTIAPLAPSRAPRGSVSFSASGGSNAGFTWAFVTNRSGGTLNPVTGAYQAGTTGNVLDDVKVTDSLGNVATTSVSVGPGVSIAPDTPSTPPLGSIGFSASGGSNAGFTWAFVTNASGATLGAGSGVYKAGGTPNVTDTIKVTDSLGNVAQTQISVGAGIAVSPAATSSPPKGAVAFGATGGNGVYTFAFVTNASGGAIDAAGNYTAGATGGVTDKIKATDSLGNSAQATITVTAAVSITPSAPSVAPLGAVGFSASGGSGAGYSWSFVTNASGGTIDPASGAYKAGAAGNAVDKVQVVDSLGNVAQTTISVGLPLTIAPTSATVPPRGAKAFVANGGAGNFVYTLQTNASGATIDAATGAYTAGTKPNVTDVVKVTDQNGASVTATAKVGPAIAVTPSAPAVPPKGLVLFTATGGAGTGYTWTLTSNASGATIDPTTGAYTAGLGTKVTDKVSVKDPLGNSAEVSVSVGSGLAINPPSASVAPRATITFVATGGSGSGYVWSLAPGPSGGTIDQRTGVYTAGPNGNVTDFVAVIDSVGNTAAVEVKVGAAVRIVPETASVAAGDKVEFAVSGGSGAGYSWSLESYPSGGRIDAATGVYVAGLAGGTVDVVKVTDSQGNVARAQVNVAPRVAGDVSGGGDGGGGDDGGCRASRGGAPGSAAASLLVVGALLVARRRRHPRRR